jgi:hypothetical protein
VNLPTPHFESGTLGAVVRDAGGAQVFGLSNFHVLACDPFRQRGDKVLQPEVSPVFGALPGSVVGALERWAFPESVPVGEVDGAICTLDVASAAAVREIGLVNGTCPPELGMPVRKRGRSTALTFGHISGCQGSPTLDIPGFGIRRFTRQIEIRVDFPQSIIFADHGDSGSLVVNGLNQAVGLLFAASDTLDFPQTGLANPIDAVKRELGVSFFWPQPRIDVVVPIAFSPLTVALIQGSGFLLASSVRFGEIESTFQVVDDRQINAVVPFGSGTVPISIDGPGGTGIGGSFTF